MTNFYKKKIQLSLYTILISCFLCACGSKSDSETGTNIKSQTDIPDSETLTPSAANEENGQETAPTSPPSSVSSPSKSSRYHATIYDNLAKGTKLELDIAENDIINLDEFINLLGYNFVGCYDSPTETNEQYINEDGLVCTEIVSDVTLYAWYEPKNYTLSFTCNGQNASDYGLQNTVAEYDSNICEVLPLNKIIGENMLIYSASYNNLFLTDITSDEKVLLNEATFQSSDIFTDNTRIILDLKTVVVNMEEHFGLQEVCIKDDYDQFEQRFKDDYICDGLSFADVNFELLNDESIEKIVVIGRFKWDVLVRLKYAKIKKDKLMLIDDMKTLLPKLKNETNGSIYSMVCFDMTEVIRNLIKEEADGNY